MNRLITILLSLGVTPIAFGAVQQVQLPAVVPYAENATVTLGPPFVNNFVYLPTITGRRIMIEFASVSCTAPLSDSISQVQLVVSKLTGGSATYRQVAFIPMQRTGPAPFGGYVWEGFAPVKAYSDTSTNGANGIYFNVYHTDSTVSATCTVSASGQVILRS